MVLIKFNVQYMPHNVQYRPHNVQYMTYKKQTSSPPLKGKFSVNKVNNTKRINRHNAKTCGLYKNCSVIRGQRKTDYL